MSSYDYYLYKELLYKVASEAEAFDEYFGYRRKGNGRNGFGQ